jgi:Flp pilus assembly protein TadB
MMKTGMVVWLICSALCIISFAYGQSVWSAYFLVLSCVLPSYISKELRRRQRL